MTEHPLPPINDPLAVRLPLPGDWGIKPGRGLAMWIVRVGTFSRYGHAAEVVDVDPDAPLPVKVVEPMPGGVRVNWVRADEFRWSTGGPLDAVLTSEIRKHLVARSYAQIGKGYDWPSVLEFVPRAFGAKIRGQADEHPDMHLMCSELVVWNRRLEAIEHGIPELDMFPWIAPGSVPPGWLQDWCPRSPGGKP